LAGVAGKPNTPRTVLRPRATIKRNKYNFSLLHVRIVRLSYILTHEVDRDLLITRSSHWASSVSVASNPRARICRRMKRGLVFRSVALPPTELREDSRPIIQSNTSLVALWWYALQHVLIWFSLCAVCPRFLSGTHEGGFVESGASLESIANAPRRKAG
jgi:hypothetical protein